MPRRTEPETPSLKWIHRIRERQYKKTKGLPLEAWLRAVDVDKAVQSLRRLGLKVNRPTRKRSVRSRD